MRILWDEPKRQATIEKHGLDLADLTEEFFAAAVWVPAKAGRVMAIGELGGTVVTVVATRPGTETIPVISMRRADRKEAPAWPGRGPAS